MPYFSTNYKLSNIWSLWIFYICICSNEYPKIRSLSVHNCSTALAWWKLWYTFVGQPITCMARLHLLLCKLCYISLREMRFIYLRVGPFLSQQALWPPHIFVWFDMHHTLTAQCLSYDYSFNFLVWILLSWI